MAGRTYFHLDRFVAAQAPVYEQVLAELKAGHKESHWMWFIFPQMKGLGHSAMAQLFGLASRAEAEAYLRHPVLGRRLIECTQAAINAAAPSVRALFGTPDDMKFRSSMTLFSIADDRAGDIFSQALGLYCHGERDARTLQLLEKTA